MSAGFDLGRVLRLLEGRRVAVICTPASWVPGHGNVADYLLNKADVRGFLALEHGFRGELQDGVLFDSYAEPRSGRPVFSFYGESHTFPEPFFKDIDTVFFHVQDISHRAYTYKLALADTLIAAARAGKGVVILDRPSPLAHLGSRGPQMVQYFPLPLPVLLSVTLGELAQWLKHRQAIDVDLTVVPVRNWRRESMWPDTGLPWIPPSPNIPSLDSAYCYAVTYILQHTNVSEGRGTCKPFEYFGAPFVDGPRLVEHLNDRRLPGVVFREVWFRPAAGKHAGEACAGAHMIIQDHEAFRPMRTLFTVVREIARLHPAEFTLSEPFSDSLDGEDWTVDKLSALDVDAALARTDPPLAAFLKEISAFLLY